MKTECTRTVLVSFVRAAFQQELEHYVTWFNAERPHSRFGACTPDEIYFARMPACRKPRFEPRAGWPRQSRCARPQALVRGRPGAHLEIDVRFHAGRRHLPVVALRRAA